MRYMFSSEQIDKLVDMINFEVDIATQGKIQNNIAYLFSPVMFVFTIKHLFKLNAPNVSVENNTLIIQ